MFNSSDVNRFVLDEFKNNNTQQTPQLKNKLFRTTTYSSKPQNSAPWRFGKWLCHKRVQAALQSLEDIGLIDMDENVENQYMLSGLAKSIFFPQSGQGVDQDKLLEWTYVVGDKQYFLYSWNDTKVQGLLTVDGALMAGILFILQLLDSATTLKLTAVPLIIYAVSFLLLACSIVYCLIHTIPKLNSKMGHGHNLKTMIGINRFVMMQRMLGGKKYFNAEAHYFENVKVLSVDDLLVGNIQPIVCYLFDNSSAPTGVRYFINKTRPAIKYWGIDSGVSSLDCNFIRTHSFFGLCAENYFKIRLKESQPTFKYDFPPYVLFDQKATLVLPFWSKTREFFTDEIRDLIIFSTPLLSETIELEGGECVSIKDFSSRPPSQRAYYLKYAGSNVSMNWGSRAVYRLSNETSKRCEELLLACLNSAQSGQIWLLQKELASKCEVEYWDRTATRKVEKRNVKYSTFYGPFGLIGMSSYYRKHYKVHGQYDTILSLVVPESND